MECKFKNAAAALLIIFLGLAAQATFGQNRTPNEVEKLNALRERAERGDSKAAADLGWTYLHQPAPNYAEALRWYQQAANGGDVAARFAVGDMYFHGQGVSKDYAEAARWYRCPKPDDRILSSCAEGTQEHLPPEARKAFRKLSFCNLDDGSGTAIALSDDRTPVYSVSCYEPLHGEYLEVLIGKVDGVWKNLGSGYGFWNCHNLFPLPTKHEGFHDVCHPNVCSPGSGSQGKPCVPDVEEFRHGQYHSANSNDTAHPTP